MIFSIVIINCIFEFTEYEQLDSKRLASAKFIQKAAVSNFTGIFSIVIIRSLEVVKRRPTKQSVFTGTFSE